MTVKGQVLGNTKVMIFLKTADLIIFYTGKGGYDEGETEDSKKIKT